MKLTYLDPNTFVPTEMEFDDIHVEIANLLLKSMEYQFKTTPIIVTEPTSLAFGVANIDRKPGEEHSYKFKITIEKTK
jgi:hypothetical protein